MTASIYARLGPLEAVLPGDPRGQPVPYYRGLVALVATGPTLALVTADGRPVEAADWPAGAEALAAAWNAAVQREAAPPVCTCWIGGIRGEDCPFHAGPTPRCLHCLADMGGPRKRTCPACGARRAFPVSRARYRPWRGLAREAGR